MTTKTERQAISLISEPECKRDFGKDRENATAWAEKSHKDSERAIPHRKHYKKILN